MDSPRKEGHHTTSRFRILHRWRVVGGGWWVMVEGGEWWVEGGGWRVEGDGW